jgi:hypothetical protein
MQSGAGRERRRRGPAGAVRNGRIGGGEIAHEFATSALLPKLERKLVADALQRA